MHAQRMYTKWTRNFRYISRMIGDQSGVLAPGRLHIPQERFSRIVMRLRLPFILSTLLRGPDVIRQVQPSKFLRMVCMATIPTTPLRWPVFLVPAAVAKPASPAKLGEARLTWTRQRSEKRTPWTGVTCMSGSIPHGETNEKLCRQTKTYGLFLGTRSWELVFHSNTGIQ